MIALALLFVFGFGLMTEVAAGDDDSSVPACCRRLGKHHCGMPGGTERAVREKVCFVSPHFAPYAPGRSFAAAAPQIVFAGVASRPAEIPQVEAGRRISFSRTRQKRGPPILL